MGLGATYWSGRFSSWPQPQTASPGYTLLVPVPGDLPVFLELALAVLGRQRSAHRIETLVIPDKDTEAIRNVVAPARDEWQGPLELVKLPIPERYVLPRLNNPSRNHGVQVIEGITRARGSHVLLHDADLFMLSDDTLDDHYRATSEAGLSACGVSPVWDGWFADHGLNLAATWELMAARNWLRAFPPALHMGHTAELFGELHVFDTTLHAQAVTDPAKIEVHDRDASIVHFNYVISTYRHFQRSSGTFIDDRFRLLLVRLFIDLFAREPYDYVVPTLDELSVGLRDQSARVTYPSADDETRESYGDYRAKVERILTGPWTDDDRRRRAADALASFDAHYSCEGTR